MKQTPRRGRPRADQPILESPDLSPAARFHLFPRLPKELRQIIWRFNLESRIIEIAFYNHAVGFYSKRCTPPALRVCQDSRDAVIGFYPLCFGSSWYGSRIRFNYSIDTLYLDRAFKPHVPYLFSTLKDELSQLRILAIDEAMLLDQKGFLESFEKAVKSLTGLKFLLEVYNTGYRSARNYKHFPRVFRQELLAQLQDPKVVNVFPWLPPKSQSNFASWNMPQLRLVWGLRKSW